MKPTEAPGTVQRVLRVIQYFAQNRESTLKEMSEALSLPPSTCHRLLEIMKREGFIDTVRDKKKYCVGTELIRVCAEIRSQHDISTVAMPFVRKVSEETGETVVFATYLRAIQKVCYTLKYDSSSPLRFDLRLNRPNSLIWGASGQSIAAFLPQRDVDLAYSTEESLSAAGDTLPPREELERKLSDVREKGYAITFGEKTPGSIGIGAPVFDKGGDVLGSLVLVYPSLRLADHKHEQFAQLVRSAASDMSALLVGNATDSSDRQEFVNS